MKKTLEQILENEKANRHEEGMFGVTACKQAIRGDQRYTNKSLYELLGEYVERANKDAFFNKTMILACWELINGDDEAERGQSIFAYMSDED